MSSVHISDISIFPSWHNSPCLDRAQGLLQLCNQRYLPNNLLLSILMKNLSMPILFVTNYVFSIHKNKFVQMFFSQSFTVPYIESYLICLFLLSTFNKGVFKIRLFVDSEKLIKLFNRSSRGESLRSTLSALGIGNFRLRTLEKITQLAKWFSWNS